MEIEIIHESLVNGQKKQAAEQIKSYPAGSVAFFEDYRDYLLDNDYSPKDCFDYYSGMVLSFLRMKG